MDIQKMMKEAEELQKSLEKAQAELANIQIKGIAGGGLVEVLMTAQGEIKGIKIKKEAVNPGDVETLEDLIMSAIYDGNNKALAISNETLGKLTDKMSPPPPA